MNDFFINLATAIIAVFSLIISIISIIIARKEKAKEYAPIIEVNQSYYNGSKYAFPDVESQVEELKEDVMEDFILDRRLFCLKENAEEEKNESYFSLFIDTSVEEDDSTEIKNIVGFDRLVIRNVGYSLSKIIINEITFHKNNQIKVLNKATRNKLLLNMRKNDEIEILVSGRFGKNNYQPFISKTLGDDTGEYAEKLSTIKEDTNLLNTRCISGADNWDKIITRIQTENLYGDSYTQEIEFSIENNTYYMKTSAPELIKKRTHIPIFSFKSNIHY